jgi:hypothetical protein
MFRCLSGTAFSLCAVSLLCGAIPPRYSGSPIAQVFTERDLPGSPQTRSVLAHPNGLIYVGNTEGVVEYDGSSWRSIPGTGGIITHNVAADDTGRIWYSGTGEFGFLIADENGALIAHPLQTQLAPEDGDVGHVLRMLVHGDEAYFVTQGARGFVAVAGPRGEVRKLSTAVNERPVSLFLHEGAVHVITTVAVYRIDGAKLIRVPDAQELVNVSVRSVWPTAAVVDTPPGSSAATTPPKPAAWVVSSAGLRLWRDGAAPLVSNDVEQLLEDDRVSCGCPLGDGTFALGTERHGVLIVDGASGRVLAHYDDDGGLGSASSTIVALTLDAEGGLWLARFAGVTRIQVRTAAALHHQTVGGVRGRVQAFAFHGERLHVATTQGVFVRNPASGRFDPLPDAVGDTWVLLPTEDGLIVGGVDLRLLRNDGGVDIIEPARLLFRSAARLRRDPDRILACTGPGLARIYHREQGRWRFEATLPNVRASLYPLIEDDDGSLWATRNRLELVRLDWREGMRLDAKVEPMGRANGLPFAGDNRTRIRIFLLNGRIEVTTRDGVWRHDSTRDRFVPEERVEGLDLSRWSRPYPLSDGSLWFTNSRPNDPLALARPVGPQRWQLEPLPYTGLEAIQPIEICDDPSTNTVWLGHLGLASFDRNHHGERAPPPAVRLRSIAAGGKILWGGAVTPPSAPLLPEQNSLQFTFAAPSFQPDAYSTVNTQYRAKLVDFDSEWSSWSPSAQRDYSNLPPGRYSFHIQARDGSGREGPVASFDINLLPPWWRTWWAYGMYGLATAGSVAGIVRLRTRVLHRGNERLAATVSERTQTLSQQNQELARLHRLELDEKITAKLAAEKSRLETLRYQLNPHFLFNSLTLIRSQIPPGLLRARDAIDRLADFCRITLHDHRADERVSLEEEIAMLRSYLAIERSRLGDLLTVKIDLDSAAAPELLPRLILLPLVENALKYGAATSDDHLEIHISAQRTDGQLVIEIANTGRWVDAPADAKVASLGIGHENIRERLKRHYPDGHAFTHNAGDGWVRVKLNLGRSTRVPSSVA